MTEQNAIVTSNSAFLAPAIDVRGAIARYEAFNQFIGAMLKEGTDYGKVPGSDKPTLLKPGAEKLSSFFGLSPRFITVEKVEDWTGEQHGGEPFFYYRYKCQLYRGDNLIAEGEGSCNSWEKKYRYRQSERTCPTCGKSTIIKGKAEYGGGWVCFARKGGCGAKFKDTDPAIVNQVTGQIKNPDPADIVNTIQKMAQKRALVAPVLLATNASERFTQDIEDFVPDAEWTSTPTEPQHQPTQNAPTQPEPAETLASRRERNWKSEKVTWAFAETVTSSNGERYVDTPADKLGFMRRSLEKSIGNATITNQAEQDAHNEKQLKLDTIIAIQESDK